jgi:hypothetical protein
MASKVETLIFIGWSNSKLGSPLVDRRCRCVAHEMRLTRLAFPIDRGLAVLDESQHW